MNGVILEKEYCYEKNGKPNSIINLVIVKSHVSVLDYLINNIHT